jgi:hypothetical protein
LLLGLLQLAIFYDIEGWDMVTSIYFIVVTLTTIGYGDYGKFIDSFQVLTIRLRTYLSKTETRGYGEHASAGNYSRVYVSAYIFKVLSLYHSR